MTLRSSTGSAGAEHAPRRLSLAAKLGTRGELVIGLAPDATSHEAHSWVEVRGEDVGPPPSRMGHSEMVRYGD